MCKPISEMEKEMLAVIHKHEPKEMMIAFAGAMSAGACQVAKYIADTYINDFSEHLRQHVVTVGKSIDIIEAINDEKDPAKKKALEVQLDELIKPELAAIDAKKNAAVDEITSILGKLFGEDDHEHDGLEGGPPEVKAIVDEITGILGKHGTVKVRAVKMPKMGDQLRH